MYGLAVHLEHTYTRFSYSNSEHRLMLLLRANLLFFASILLTQAYGSALAPVILPRATVCNGHAELCSRSYGNVSYVGAHDSYAFKVGARKSYSTNPLLSSLIAER